MRIGIDLGGTKIEGIVLGESGETLACRRLPSPQGDYRATLDAIAGLVLDLEREAGGRGSVGVGIPGALSPATGRIKNANSTWIIGEALDRDLEQRLGRPVRLENDAKGKSGKQYSHDLLTEDALAFIRAVKDEPFFLYIPFTIPHVSLQVPDSDGALLLCQDTRSLALMLLRANATTNGREQIVSLDDLGRGADRPFGYELQELIDLVAFLQAHYDVVPPQFDYRIYPH